MTVANAIRQIGVTEVTYYRWRSEYGGLKSDQVRRIKKLEQENARLRRAVSDLMRDKLILQGKAGQANGREPFARRTPREITKPFTSPGLHQSRPADTSCFRARRGEAMLRMDACRLLGQHRSTQRRLPHGREDEEQLTADITARARQYARYGYRKIAELLRHPGWLVNDKRVERIWKREGRKVPAKQPK